MSSAAFGNVLDMSGVIWECLGISEGVCGKLEGIREAERGVWQSFVSNIKMSQRYGRFELLGSLGRGFKAEL